MLLLLFHTPNYFFIPLTKKMGYDSVICHFGVERRVEYARHGCGNHGYGRMGMLAMARHGCGSDSGRSDLARDKVR